MHVTDALIVSYLMARITKLTVQCYGNIFNNNNMSTSKIIMSYLYRAATIQLRNDAKMITANIHTRGVTT